jgi:hypothetical protein
MEKRRERVDSQFDPISSEERFFSLIDRMYEEQGFELLDESSLESVADNGIKLEA